MRVKVIGKVIRTRFLRIDGIGAFIGAGERKERDSSYNW